LGFFFVADFPVGLSLVILGRTNIPDRLCGPASAPSVSQDLWDFFFADFLVVLVCLSLASQETFEKKKFSLARPEYDVARHTSTSQSVGISTVILGRPSILDRLGGPASALSVSQDLCDFFFADFLA